MHSRRNLVLIVAGIGVLFTSYKLVSDLSPTILSIPTTQAVTTQTVNSPFLYNFGTNGILDETGSMQESSSPYWWVNSGGQLLIANGVGETVQGAVPLGQRWQLAYALGNPLDTGKGFYPQNIFRLVTRSTWQNFDQEVAFKIVKLNMTDTPNRDGYSGILLFNRYKDSDNLYNAGLRQDGTAVIKKKIGGVSYTMAQGQVFQADSGYNKNSNPNLIPGNRWMKLKTETRDMADGSLSITLWLDKTNSGTWTKILSATDAAGRYGGTSVIKGAGSAGIRTDYMDVQFDNYKVTEL